MTKDEKYREILISPVRKCAGYTPKFGHGRDGGFTLSKFQALYGSDDFYEWLGLDDPLMYSAHKAAGGITSIYRQIGIGCERLVREIFMDSLGLTEDGVKWSYQISGTDGKKRTLSLDGRIIVDDIADASAKQRVADWIRAVYSQIKSTDGISNAISGIVFEVRQGYKSKDSKRQNADIANARYAYTSGYIPCLMVMSSQIDDDIVMRYSQNNWVILRGYPGTSIYSSTYDFCKDVIGYDLADFMRKNQTYFQNEIHRILDELMKAQ